MLLDPPLILHRCAVCVLVQAQEEAQKAQEANSKKEGEQAQKDKVAQAQREAQAEHAKALKDLELKKKEEVRVARTSPAYGALTVYSCLHVW